MEEGAILRDYAFLTGDRVPHAGATQRVHTFHDDKRGLLQRYNTQMVILLLLCLRTHSGPHVVLHLQGLVFPLPHLHRDKQDSETSVRDSAASPSVTQEAVKQRPMDAGPVHAREKDPF